MGDVQGCALELEKLLARARAEFDADFDLWIVGDVVNRGPDNLRALELVRELVDSGRGHYVLGNHELILLRVAAGQRALGPLDSLADVLESPEADAWIEWLRRRPIAVSGRLGEQPFVMVHAALHPSWALAELERRARRVEARLGGASRSEAEGLLAAEPAADADADTLGRVTGCRSVTDAGGWSSEPPEFAPPGHRAWHEAWSAERHAYGVVFGHWALQGLYVAPGLRGLDTGCVHHGRGRRGFLTAWVPSPGRKAPFSLPDDDFWQVPASRAYYARRDDAAVDAAGDSD